MADQFNHTSNRSYDLWDHLLTGAGIIATADERIAEECADKNLWEIGRVLSESKTGEARQ